MYVDEYVYAYGWLFHLKKRSGYTSQTATNSYSHSLPRCTDCPRVQWVADVRRVDFRNALIGSRLSVDAGGNSIADMPLRPQQLAAGVRRCVRRCMAPMRNLL